MLIDDTPKQNKKLKKRLFTDMENSIPRAKAGSHGADVWDKESIHLSRIAQRNGRCYGRGDWGESVVAVPPVKDVDVTFRRLLLTESFGT